jgi:ABC-type molybdate transport system substrate-binding protein
MSIRTGNRTGVLGPLAVGKAHAAITWSCAVVESGRKDVETIAIPAEKNVVDPLLIAILKTCQQKARAQAFLDYLATDPATKMLKEFRLRE